MYLFCSKGYKNLEESSATGHTGPGWHLRRVGVAIVCIRADPYLSKRPNHHSSHPDKHQMSIQDQPAQHHNGCKGQRSLRRSWQGLAAMADDCSQHIRCNTDLHLWLPHSSPWLIKAERLHKPLFLQDCCPLRQEYQCYERGNHILKQKKVNLDMTLRTSAPSTWGIQPHF